MITLVHAIVNLIKIPFIVIWFTYQEFGLLGTIAFCWIMYLIFKYTYLFFYYSLNDPNGEILDKHRKNKH
jgi:hypothetical protein